MVEVTVEHVPGNTALFSLLYIFGCRYGCQAARGRECLVTWPVTTSAPSSGGPERRPLRRVRGRVLHIPPERLPRVRHQIVLREESKENRLAE